MYNWNTDEDKLKENFPKEYKLWRLIQLVNYGLDGEKLSVKELRSAWPKIKDRLAPDKRKTLEYLLWNKKWQKAPGLLPNRNNYWDWLYKSHTS